VTIRIGFYGAGFISRYHQLLLSQCPVEHAIVAVHDVDEERAAAFAEQTGASVTDEDALLDLVDVVYVTTWTAEHPRLVAKAAEHGLAVFCEKPLAFDTATAETMVAGVERAGVTNQVGLVLRFVPAFRWAKRLVDDPRAGRTMAVVFRDDQFIPNQGMYASDWRVDAARAGHGTLLEHSIHDTDILQWLLGPVTSLSATTRELHGHPGIEDVAAARLDFASGATATLTSVWHDVLERPSQRRVEVFCENLHLAVEGDFVGPVRWQLTGEPEQVLEGDELIEALRAAGDPDPGNPATAFLTAVRDGTRASPSLADALPAHRLVDAMYASAASGGAVVDDPMGTGGLGT